MDPILPTEDIQKIMDLLPVSQVKGVIKPTSSYWIYRFKNPPKLRSRKEVFKYMKNGHFHPVLMRSLEKYNPLNVMIENVSKMNKNMFIHTFILISENRSDIILAEKLNMPEIIAGLLKKYPKKMYEKFQHILCKFAKNNEVLEVLIEKGYKLIIHHLDKQALVAISEKNKLIDLVDWDISNVDTNGNTPLQRLISFELYKESLVLLNEFGELCNTYWAGMYNNTALISICRDEIESWKRSYLIPALDPFREKLALELINNYDCEPLHATKGKTAYLDALLSKMTVVADLLFAKYGDKCIPDQPDENGCTPLIGVIRAHSYDEHRAEVAEMLIDNYPDRCFPSCIYTNSYYSFSALSASIHAKLDISIKIIDTFGINCFYEPEDSLLSSALIIQGNERVALKLLDTFGELCNVNHINKWGYNALYQILYYYHHWHIDDLLRAIEKIIDLGCDLEYKYSSSYALDTLFYRMEPDEKIILLLLEKGYNPNNYNKDLMYKACFTGYYDVAIKLLKGGYICKPEYLKYAIKEANKRGWENIVSKLKIQTWKM